MQIQGRIELLKKESLSYEFMHDVSKMFCRNFISRKLYTGTLEPTLALRIAFEGCLWAFFDLYFLFYPIMNSIYSNMIFFMNSEYHTIICNCIVELLKIDYSLLSNLHKKITPNYIFLFLFVFVLLLLQHKQFLFSCTII